MDKTRQSTKQQWVLIAILVVVILGSGVGGTLLLRQTGRTRRPGAKTAMQVARHEPPSGVTEKKIPVSRPSTGEVTPGPAPANGVLVGVAPVRMAGPLLSLDSQPVASGFVETPYNQIADVAVGVAGGRGLVRIRPAAPARMAGANPSTPQTQPAYILAADQPQAPSTRLDMNDPQQARAAMLARRFSEQLAGGNVDKALDAYYELKGMATADTDSSGQARQQLQSLDALDGLEDLPQLLLELLGDQPQKTGTPAAARQ